MSVGGDSLVIQSKAFGRFGLCDDTVKICPSGTRK
jgi:hypothetical protein